MIQLCGQPCSGKSSVCKLLVDLLTERGTRTAPVGEEMLTIDKNDGYRDMPNEKNTRGALRSEVERQLRKDTVVLVDSINNIKGYRYELWCLARASASRYVLVFVDTPVETCRQWNSKRPVEEQYETDILEDLVRRFETPNALRSRWDSPLFHVKPAEQSAAEVAQVLGEVVNAILDTSTNMNARVARELTPNLATSNPGLAPTDLLGQMDKAAQGVVDAIIGRQAGSEGAAGVTLQLSPGEPPLQLPRPLSLPELRRHKRDFLRLATKLAFSRLQSAEQARNLFLQYLGDNVN